MKPQIVSLGQLVADMLVRPVDRMPRAGTADIVESIQLRCGGCALNTAIALKKLGVPVAAAGKIGPDVFGDFLLDQMRQLGLNVQAVKTDSRTRTSSTVVLIASSGERSFLYAPGGNEDLTNDEIDFDFVRQAKILHVGGVMKLRSLRAAEIMKKAKRAGLTTSLDTDWDPSGRWRKILEPCLAYTDLFLTSLEEARQISGKRDSRKIGEFFLDAGVKVFVLKMGADGCYIATPEQQLTLPAFKVDVVDTTGAGDAFVAGFLAGYLKGWPLERVGKLAGACGAMCVTKIGATDGVASLDETLKFIQSRA